MLSAIVSRMRLARARPDEGFTLVELLVTISILGIVVLALTGVVFSYLRVSTETSTRLNESTDQQFVSAYWQQDVSSLGMHDVPTGGAIPNAQGVWSDGTAPGCTPPSGTPVVMFKWNDYKSASMTDPDLAWSTASTNRATYYTKTVTVTRPNGATATQTQLWRKRCGDTSSDIVVARYLTGAPTVQCLDVSRASTSCASTSPFPAIVTMSLSVQDKGQIVHNSTGYTSLVLTAERRQG